MEMTMANDIGKLRRSAIVGAFSPGAVVDFRAGDSAISGVVAGLEEWDANFPPKGLLNHQSVYEPRLQQKLGVRGFRLPPVIDENYRDKNNQPDGRRLVAARFPDWLQCPQCDRIAPSANWNGDPGKPYKFCGNCTSRAPGQRKVFTVPVRFVMVCEAGHLDDFPWHWFVGHKSDCSNRTGALALKSEAPGLSGLFLRCPKCGERRPMSGIFSEATWNGWSCTGMRPWLGDREPCTGNHPRATQRGASNLYFPVIESALSIPPWSDSLQEALGMFWSVIVNTPLDQRADFIGHLARGPLGEALAELNMGPGQLANEIERRVQIMDSSAALDIRGEEFRQFTIGGAAPRLAEREFETRSVDVPASLIPFFERIVRVVRLREVRAIRGFTRIHAASGATGENVVPISRNPLDWLPAIEVRGEGIFLQFSESAIEGWMQTNRATLDRSILINEAWTKEWRQRFGEGQPPQVITPRYLLVHTFAHVLMRQLTLESGYSSAALRERLYVQEPPNPMAGVLIYTGTSDADGTLGGLERHGLAARLEPTVKAAIQSIEWCSSDPLCIEGLMSGTEGLSFAACHACVLAPETSCELFNRFLDRAMLVGTPDDPEQGFFRRLIGV
jgi:hypothetical protein